MIFIACALLLTGLFQLHRAFKLYGKMCDLERAIREGAPDKPKPKEADVKRPAANRHPRTLEQRAKAAERRREWWAKKRALDKQAQDSKKTETKLDG